MKSGRAPPRVEKEEGIGCECGCGEEQLGVSDISEEGKQFKGRATYNKANKGRRFSLSISRGIFPNEITDT